MDAGNQTISIVGRVLVERASVPVGRASLPAKA